MKKAFKKRKKKKSAGNDGLSQEQLVFGASSLAPPSTEIINLSIKSGEFPTNWKEAMVSPVLKKGNRELVEKYRPVSCLEAAGINRL